VAVKKCPEILKNEESKGGERPNSQKANYASQAKKKLAIASQGPDNKKNKT